MLTRLAGRLLSVRASFAVAVIPLLLVFAQRARDPASAAAAGQPLIQETERISNRVVYFSGNGVSGEYCINYARPQWKAEYEQGFDEQTLGKRVRLGKDYWSSLDTFTHLEVGGEKVKPGYYFLALERSKKGAWSLVLLDHEQVRSQTLDAFGTTRSTGGLEIALEHAEAPAPADHLRIAFVPDPQDPRKQTLEILFGPHRLTTTVVPKV